MPIDQNCPASGLVFVARPDDRVSLCGNKIRLQPDARKFFHEPICTLLQLFFVLVISRNAWETQKRIKLFEVIVAHGHKSKPGLPQASTNQPARTNCRAGASPAGRNPGKRSARPTTTILTRLPVRDAQRTCARNISPTRERARFRSPQIPEPWRARESKRSRRSPARAQFSCLGN